MMAKLYIFFTYTALLCIFSSCLSFDSKRGPAQAEIRYAGSVQQLLVTGFDRDGYAHAQKRNFGSGKISIEQSIKELAGRSIWFKSAPNERHHAYVFPQKVGVAIDWNQALDVTTHDSRFQTWGLINDPDCCIPGKTCEAKQMRYNGRAVTMADTYGWEYCEGDETLLNSVRKKTGYRDPACDDPVIKAADSLDAGLRENRCELAFGTSAGAVGFRKFPNPRFNEKRWQKIGGWRGYSERMIRDGINNSIQPPFRVAKACAACHASFDPLNPPRDISNPQWAHIKGETGNQYLNVSKLLATGMKEETVENQLFTHTRPGVVDTSAVPHDFINDSGTINAVINLPARPLFEEEFSRWVQVEKCNETDTRTCQKVSYRNENAQVSGSKYWSWQKVAGKIPHILKGGEDSVGYDLAVQRVYVNIGMCSEQCWMNHLTNLRELDYTSRGYGQTPFDIGQCRRDCASFRANEDRVKDIFSYLNSRRPTNLKEALSLPDDRFKNFLETRYGAGSIEQGGKLFVTSCAQCHSSAESADFNSVKTLDTGEIIGADWLGNDKATPVTETGTYSCRALHSNHKQGHVWQDFSSDTYKKRAPVSTDGFNNKISGGPGYYRNISLLNVWAHAPFLHNNAIGPEICGNTVRAREAVKTTGECELNFDPSVQGRLLLFEKSVDELLTPSSQRTKKITHLVTPIRIPLGLRGMELEIPAGMPLNMLANFDVKSFVYDFTFAGAQLENFGEQGYRKYWQSKFSGSPAKADELGQAVRSLLESLNSVSGVINLAQKAKRGNFENLRVIAKYYRTCETDDVENAGHNFGTDLTHEQKQALKAFMATL